MTDLGHDGPDLLDPAIARRLRSYARAAASETSGRAVARRVAAAYPRPHGLAAELRWRLGGLRVDAPALRWASMVVVAVLLVAVLVVALVVASGLVPRHSPRPLLFVRDGELVAASADGEPERVLGAADQAAWSPDGQSIAVFRSQEGLWVMSRDGTEERLVGPGCSIEGPWSPNGRAILAVCATGSFAVVDAAQPSIHDLGGLQLWKDAVSGTWSPDGSQIAVAVKDSIVVVRADGTQARTVSREPLGWLPRWSPDGTTIAYATDVAIRRVRPDGTDDRVLARVAGSPCELAWAPDGRSIAFARTACPEGTAASGVVDVASGTVQKLSSPIAGASILDLAWSPDGGRLALLVGVIGCQPGEASVWVVDWDGSHPSEISAHADCGFAAFGGPTW